MVVKMLIKMTDRGHPCKMPFVAAKGSPKQPSILNDLRRLLYMPAIARSGPSAKPRAAAHASTIPTETISKHLT